MGLIFDKRTAQIYESWYRSSQGRAIDRSVGNLIVSLLDPKPGERVLDIGCGSGNHLIILNRMGLNVSGIDASPLMVRKAKERLGQRCLLRTGIAESLPFGDNEFDLAVFINSLEFLDDPLKALREAGRVTNRKVFVGVINSLSWNGLLRRVQGYLGDPLFNRARFYNLWQIRSLMQMAYGPVPISWECIKVSSSFDKKSIPSGLDSWVPRRSPFGFFLGFSATLLYRVRTNTLPLLDRVKRRGNSLIGAKTIEDLKHIKGDSGNERGLPI